MQGEKKTAQHPPESVRFSPDCRLSLDGLQAALPEVPEVAAGRHNPEKLPGIHMGWRRYRRVDIILDEGE